MIALGYGVTYIWGTVGIILICKYLPRWWGIDARKAAQGIRGRARRQERRRRRPHRLPRRRPARLSAREHGGRRPEHRASSASRIRSTGSSTSCAATRSSAPTPDIVLQPGDVIALGGRLEDLTANLGLIGPEVPDAKALNIPLDQAEILVTNKDVDGKRAEGVPRRRTSPASCRSTRIERAGEPIPLGTETKLQRFDVLFVAGLKAAVDKVAAKLGQGRATEHVDRPADAVGRHGARPADRPDQRAGRRLLGRPRQCRRPAAVGHPRVVGRVAAALLRQHAERRAQHPRGPRAS